MLSSYNHVVNFLVHVLSTSNTSLCSDNFLWCCRWRLLKATPR